MLLRRAVAAVLALALGLVGGAARADDEEARSRQAQALFDHGKELFDKGQVTEACRLLAESQRLEAGGGTLLNLAVCHEKEGRLAKAWVEYNDALSSAIRDGRADRQALATESLRSLLPRVPHLRVDVAPDAPRELDVRVDGSPLSSFAFGTPLPEDPGPHEVAATAPGRVPWSWAVPSLAEGASIEVRVPVLAPVAPPPPRIAKGAYVAGGAALAGYAVTTVTGILALSAQASANAGCHGQNGFCVDPNGPGDAERARTLAWVSTLSLGVAIAATAVAVFWPRTHAAAKSTGFDVGPTGVSGKF